MDALLSKSCGIAAAQRGQIVQRVLVDGWSTAQAAATFGLQEWRVARWVADYRRDGMASLREDDSAEGLLQHWFRRLRSAFSRSYGGLRGGFGPGGAAPLGRPGASRGGGGRRHWP